MVQTDKICLYSNKILVITIINNIHTWTISHNSIITKSRTHMLQWILSKITRATTIDYNSNNIKLINNIHKINSNSNHIRLNITIKILSNSTLIISSNNSSSNNIKEVQLKIINNSPKFRLIINIRTGWLLKIIIIIIILIIRLFKIFKAIIKPSR
jgi:hypothetical protein